MKSSNPLTQKINFAISAFFILTFGTFITATVVQAISRSALFNAISSPVNIDLGQD